MLEASVKNFPKAKHGPTVISIKLDLPYQEKEEPSDEQIETVLNSTGAFDRHEAVLALQGNNNDIVSAITDLQKK